MIKLENREVYGWEAAIRGMRNPFNSWDKSTSISVSPEKFWLCSADRQLMQNLISAGEPHSKFLRMITVTVDITAPLYWWKEFDTYKVGTISNSCSTMHSIHKRDFTLDDFSTDHLIPKMKEYMDMTIFTLNAWRRLFNETGDKECWWQMIQLLPSSYNQRRTIQLNYSVLRRMYFDRRNHKLDEWRAFCEWIKTLPCADILLTEAKLHEETSAGNT